MAVRITKDRVAEITRAIRQLTTDQVMVGIPAEDAQRDPEPGQPSAPLNNAEIGYIHEFGAPEANIPARPFLIPGVRDAEEAVIKRLRAGIIKATQGDVAAGQKALDLAGLEASNAVQEKISNGPFLPLAPMTLSKRRAKGFKGTLPLIETGQLRRAITYVIRRRGE